MLAMLFGQYYVDSLENAPNRTKVIWMAAVKSTDWLPDRTGNSTAILTERFESPASPGVHAEGVYA